jgi:hypothetical protein
MLRQNVLDKHAVALATAHDVHCVVQRGDLRLFRLKKLGADPKDRSRAIELPTSRDTQCFRQRHTTEFEVHSTGGALG